MAQGGDSGGKHGQDQDTLHAGKYSRPFRQLSTSGPVPAGFPFLTDR